MIAPKQIAKPENWQDFEKLCKKLWGEVWSCSDSIKRHGRTGQNQQGVDIYCIPEGKTAYYGIQCKGKDEYTHAQLTEKEIDNEILKAHSFKPALAKLIFATTANKDAKIEEYIRVRDIENRSKGLFSIELMSWEDIVDLLEQYQATYNWYMNNCQYKNMADVTVNFDGGDSIEINPQYVRMTKRTNLIKIAPIPEIFKGIFSEEEWKDRQLSSDSNNTVFSSLINKMKEQNDMLYGKAKHDYRWCEIIVDVENIGSVTLDDCKLYLYMDMNGVTELDGGYNYNNDWRISDNIRAQINRRIDEERDVFELKNGILFQPKESLLYTDSARFKFYIKPKDDITGIPIIWDFKSRKFAKSGELTINVVPLYIDKEVVTNVYDKDEMEETEIEITPRIE